MQSISSLMQEIGIDDAEITQRQAFLSLDANDAASLREVHAVLATHRDELIEVFYQHLL